MASFNGLIKLHTTRTLCNTQCTHTQTVLHKLKLATIVGNFTQFAAVNNKFVNCENERNAGRTARQTGSRQLGQTADIATGCGSPHSGPTADRTINSKDFNALWRRLPSRLPMKAGSKFVFRHSFRIAIWLAFHLSNSPTIAIPNPSRQSPPAAVCLACNLSLNAPDLTAANTFGFPSPAVKELRGHKALLKLANFLAVKKPKTALLIAGKPQSTFPSLPSQPRHIDTSSGKFGESANQK